MELSAFWVESILTNLLCVNVVKLEGLARGGGGTPGTRPSWREAGGSPLASCHRGAWPGCAALWPIPDLHTGSQPRHSPTSRQPGASSSGVEEPVSLAASPELVAASVTARAHLLLEDPGEGGSK